MSEKYYILTPGQAKTYEKEALKYKYSLFQLMSENCREGGAGTEDDICGIVDRIISDIARVVVHPWHSREHFIPFTKEYPRMVCNALAERVENLKVVFHEQPDDDDLIVSMTLRNNTWHLSDGYASRYDIRWDAHPLYSFYQFASNIVSYGWGNDTYCLKPDIAAELFMILDDMTGYLRDELKKIYYKVRQEMMCRQIEMNSVLSAVNEAGFRYYRLWVNSTRTVVLNVKLSGNREVDVTLYSRQINEKLNILIKDLKAAEIGEETELPCRIYEASGRWDVIQ